MLARRSDVFMSKSINMLDGLTLLRPSCGRMSIQSFERTNESLLGVFVQKLAQAVLRHVSLDQPELIVLLTSNSTLQPEGC